MMRHKSIFQLSLNSYLINMLPKKLILEFSNQWKLVTTLVLEEFRIIELSMMTELIKDLASKIS